MLEHRSRLARSAQSSLTRRRCSEVKAFNALLSWLRARMIAVYDSSKMECGSCVVKAAGMTSPWNSFNAPDDSRKAQWPVAESMAFSLIRIGDNVSVSDSRCVLLSAEELGERYMHLKCR
jgi:hypothetical protein